MHARSFRPLLAVAGLISLGASCARAQDKPRIDTAGVKPMDTTPWVPQPGILDRQGQGPDYATFGFTLFRQIADAKPNDNVIVSPLSAGLALGMLGNGATAGTRAGIEQMLAEGPLDALNPANAALAAALRTDDVELAVANSLWARQGVPFLPAFLQQNRQFYGAEIESLNLSTPQAARRINDWASRSTRGRITEMVDGPLEPQVILYLMNAVYFKGRWQDEFRPQATRPGTFHAPGGDVQRPMMSRTGSYGYVDGEGFQALRLPYRGNRFAMYVLLPDSGQSLADLRGRLSATAWRGWMGTFRPREVHVTMPKYRMSLESPLNTPLKALGMAEAFDPARASFRAMLTPEFFQGQNAYVSEAKQKVFIEVNEEGTEAAAVTGVEVRATSAPPPPQEFTVDRPFVVAIRDDQTGALLFVGQVTDPVTQ